MNIADITCENAIDFIHFCRDDLFESVEKFKDTLFISLRGYTYMSTNREMVETICAGRDYNYYFPFRYDTINSYLNEFNEIFECPDSGRQDEINLFLISIRLSDIIQDKMFDYFARITGTHIDNKEEIARVINEYSLGEFGLNRRKLLFESKLDPNEISEALILSNIENELIELTLINLGIK